MLLFISSLTKHLVLRVDAICVLFGVCCVVFVELGKLIEVQRWLLWFGMSKPECCLYRSLAIFRRKNVFCKNSLFTSGKLN